MRVRFPDSISEPFRLPNLRWRGLAFDRFDGRVWESSARQRTLLRREASGEFALATPRGTGPIVRQEIFLDPIGSDAVFAAPKALRIDTSAGAVGLDDMGSIVLPTVSTGFSTRWIPSSSRRHPAACARRRGRWKDGPACPCASSSFLRCPSASGPSPAT
jgi:hypothetical protein